MGDSGHEFLPDESNSVRYGSGRPDTPPRSPKPAPAFRELQTRNDTEKIRSYERHLHQYESARSLLYEADYDSTVSYPNVVEDYNFEFRYLADLVLSGVDRYRSFAPVKNKQVLQGDLYTEARDYISTPDAPQRLAVVHILTDTLTNAYEEYITTSASPLMTPQSQDEASARYHSFRDPITSLLRESMRVASEDLASQDTAKILESVYVAHGNIQEKDALDEYMLDPTFSRDARVRMVVARCNVFGYMDTVKHLSVLKNKTENAEVLQHLDDIYHSVQGSEVARFMKDWTGVYENYNFEQWSLNTQELTQQEVAMVQHDLEQYCGLEDQRDVAVLDSAAGTGRHVFQMLHDEWGRVDAMDFLPEYVESMQRKRDTTYAAYDGDVRILQGSWKDISDQKVLEDDTYDAVICLGRSIMHASRMSEVIETMNGFQRVLKLGGIVVIDYANPDIGQYQNKVNHMAENMKALGIQSPLENLIFDGVTDENQFNRLILTPIQMQALAQLFGMRVVEERHTRIDAKSEIENVYYTLQKVEEEVPQLSREEFMATMKDLGLMRDWSSDTDIYIDVWGMTPEQVYLFGLNTPKADRVRELNAAGNPPKICKVVKGRILEMFSL